MIPRSTVERERRQRSRLSQLLARVRREWRRIRPDGSWEQQYAEQAGPAILLAVAAAQQATAEDADSYIAEVLAELAIGPPSPSGVVDPATFVGWAGDGRRVSTLLATTVGRARATAATLTPATAPPGVALPPASPAQALADGQALLEAMVQTVIADTARYAETVAMTTRPWLDGWVRIINPPCCSRCVVLAGKFYRWSDGFQRHPRCDCRHIPSSEAGSGDLRTNPADYFDSLDRAEQNRVFTNAGAEAIRQGADISQIVNARQGMRRAQVYGRDVLVTTEGLTRRGLAYRPLSAVAGGRAADTRTRGERYFRTGAVRLMPESILELAAGDRGEAIRLLKLHGFIL